MSLEPQNVEQTAVAHESDPLSPALEETAENTISSDQESSHATFHIRRREEIGMTTRTPIRKSHRRSRSCPGAPMKLASPTGRRGCMSPRVRRVLIKFQTAETRESTIAKKLSELAVDVQGHNQADIDQGPPS
ncbi:hypothetical protein CLOM_g12710 [Closterium sp. NIES-68]|nr:hypothetical protein CLOM_g12710 [Closterium sp. NIES-68]GJP62317.1 hypothetical protein CLOP_g19397 [Closterium sp. NIES-67]